MSRVSLTVAEKLAQLRKIPSGMLPSTLKYNLVLPNISEIRFEYSRNAKQFGPMLQFYRKYIADLRYHNPHLKVLRNATEDGPLVGQVVLVSKSGMKNEQDLTIVSTQVETVEELKDRVVKLNNELL